MKDRRAYFNWYNRTVRGQPAKANTFLRVKCLMCGNLAYPSALQRTYRTYARLQRGYRHYFELGDPAVANIQGLLYETAKDKYTKMAHKCASLLRGFIAEGLITEDEIRNILGFSDIKQVERIGNISTLGILCGTPKLDRLNYMGDVGYAEGM